jgi:hypothetical protein
VLWAFSRFGMHCARPRMGIAWRSEAPFPFLYVSSGETTTQRARGVGIALQRLGIPQEPLSLRVKNRGSLRERPRQLPCVKSITASMSPRVVRSASPAEVKAAAPCMPLLPSRKSRACNPSQQDPGGGAAYGSLIDFA